MLSGALNPKAAMEITAEYADYPENADEVRLRWRAVRWVVITDR